MKTLRSIVYAAVVLAATFFAASANAQSILDPNDPIVVYNPAAPPANPPFGTIAKWVKTNRLSWNTSSYKAYYYNGFAFRLKFPKTYNPTAVDGKKYPMIIFFHGLGEKGTVYDNEFSLFHGGQQFSNNVDNGTYDGYVLVMQTENGFWGTPAYDAIRSIIDYMIVNNKLDPFRIVDNGLSAGGAATWEFLLETPTYLAGSLPMSAASVEYGSSTNVNKIKFTPMWIFQGGRDGAPDPYTTEGVRDAILAAGGNFKYTLYPTLGHGTWNTAWAEPDFYPYANRVYSSNPWVLFGKREFCPGDPINVTIGLTAGFNQYEWRKDGVLITGATGNTITVTGSAVAGNAVLGVYSARIRRGTNWSEWSRIPAEIKIKAPTVPPTITITGLQSKVIPALDGSTGVNLEVPAGYASYLWQKEGSSTTIGTTRTLNATSGGNYKVRVTEQFGCSSDFTVPFTVIDANGPNKPDAAINLIITTLSKTSLRLDWSDNPVPQNNETNFEVYRATQAGVPYTLIGLTNTDVLTFTSSGLNANTKYYFKVRAINNTGAAPASNQASGTTNADTQAPTAPANLTITGTTSSSISLSWGASSDDVAVSRYEVFVNGMLSYFTTLTQFTLNNLTFGQTYNIIIKARDASNNLSPASNQVTGQPLQAGLPYKYYTYPSTTTWNNLPDFNTLVPVTKGVMANVALTPRTQNDRFAFLWEGFITIPTTGVYYFRTNSNEGSKLWLGSLNGTTSPYNFSSLTPTVNNDGIHNAQDRTSTALSLTAGRYPIAIAYFDRTGTESMTVTWRTPASLLNFVAIPNSAFTDAPVVGGSAPAAPANLAATAVSYKRINLTWTDNSNNETAFEIWRSTNAISGFVTIGQVAANTTSYVDSSLNANTTYYYNVRAIGQFGESALASKGNGVDYGYYEVSSMSALPNFNSLTPVKTGRTTSFVLGQQNRADDFAFKFSGTINIPVSGVYTFYTKSDDGSKLYIDGFTETNRVVSNDFLQGPTERSGTINLTAGVHAIYVTFFERGGGEFLEVRYQGPAGSGIAKQIISASVLGTVYPNATTLSLPASPSAPTGLSAAGLSSSKITVSWADVADETSYELYRSNTNNGNYLLFAALPANTVSYIDSGLFANTVNYYKVRAVNVGGPSAYSNEDSAKTINSIPVVTNIPNQFMRFGTVLQLNVNATDADPETLTIQVSNLPAFGVFNSTGNGTGTITFTNPPAPASYTGITVSVTDQQGVNSSVSFDLVVNDNYPPVVSAVNNISLSEQQTAQVNISATDQNAADVLTWSFAGLPSFATPVINGGAVQISLAPGYADNGAYPVTATVNDGKSGTASVSFTITVNDVDPNKRIFINFNDGTLAQGSPWNNTNKNPVLNDAFPALKDHTGATTTIGLRVTSNWQDIPAGSNTGVNTGNNSGVYPDNVMRSFWFTNTSVQTLQVNGLNPAGKYNFTFFGSRGSVSDDRTSLYTIGSTTVSLNAANNSQNTVSINNLTPNPDGTLTLSLSKTAAAQFGYLNAMVIESLYDDGSAPAKPRNLAGQFITNKIRLNWVDAAFNEKAYEVYRSATNLPGSFSLLNPGGNNAGLQQYDDAAISGNKTYYYYVIAKNDQGNSPASDTIAVSTPNTSPVITAIADIKMKTDQIVNVNVTAADDPGDVITVQVTGLPSFATFTSNGNGTGVISIQPGSIIGTYNGITVTATDNAGASSSVQFNLIVTDKNITAYYVNFNAVLPVGAPWNSFNRVPYPAGASINNLQDEAGSSSTVSVTLVDAWTDANNLGATTGNNSGVFPDDVMQTFYYTNASIAHRIRITGLSTSGVRYNLIFFASRGGVADNRNTTYSYAGQSVTLNAASNTTNTVQLVGVTPDVNGVIEFTAQKDAAASFGYINAMVIQSYVDNGTPLAPSNLAASSSNSSIQLNWTDMSSNEDGFEVYKSQSLNGTYTLLTTTAANIKTYNDAAVTPGVIYYYKVRAKKLPSTFSSYSNTAAASTVIFTVDLNFNDGSSNPAQGGNWNNTNAILEPGYVLPGLINRNGQNTGMNFTFLQLFTGYNIYGTITGNNSGIYPDNVMAGFFYVNYGDTAKWKIDGLNLSSTYNFSFFGSRQAPTGGPVTTSYKIGNQIVTLDATANTSNVATIKGVKPDSTGTVYFTLYTTEGRGYINALTIEGALSATEVGTINQGAGSGGLARISQMPVPVLEQIDGNNPVAAKQQNDNRVVPVTQIKVQAYPSPFVDEISLRFELPKSEDRVAVFLTDITGKVVFTREFQNIPKGVSQLGLGISGNDFPAGVYFIRVGGLTQQKGIVLKVVKN